MATRKSFSAERSKKVDELSSDTSSEFGYKTFKVCSSASYESTKRRTLRERHVENLFSEEISPNYSTLNLKVNQKNILDASQTLEKLSKIIAHNTSHVISENSDSAHYLTNTGLRDIILNHDKLKKLLEERSSLMLKEECNVCIKRTIKLSNDIKQLYMKEKLKMMMMPIQACNRFVSSSDISIAALQLLLKKLQLICDLQSSVSSSYQKIVNCFHVALDLDIYHMVQKTNSILKRLNSSLFYWAFKSMELFLQKLCLADPNSVTPEFLQCILENCQIFNCLLKDNPGLRQKSMKSHDFFYDYVKNCEFKELPFSLVLNYLAFYEAKIASEKVVHFLTLTCKKSRQVDLKRNKLATNDTKIQKIDSNTSDYYSDMDADPSIIKEYSLKNANSNFVNLLLAITQRNQSLILKYLYAITSLHNTASFIKVTRRASYESSSKVYPARQMWNVPEQHNKDDNRVLLEQNYWSAFWSNVQTFIMKVLFEVPYHQYGDTTAGTVILWPDSFLHILFESLKLITENNDITFEGRQVMKQIYENIYIEKMQTSWDIEFSLAVSATHSHLCPPVPTSTNKVRTHPGNVLHACLDVGTGILNEALCDSNTLSYLKSLNALQSTLDCFLLWLNTKTRAMISSKNLASYLLISCSDCPAISQLLKVKALPHITSEDTYVKISSKYLLEQFILKQYDIINGYTNDVPNIIYNIYFDTMKDSIIFALKSQNSWGRCAVFRTKSISLDVQEDLIFLLTEVVNGLPNRSALISAFTSSFAQASIYALQNNRKPLSQSNIQLVNVELSKHFEWIDKLNLLETEKCELRKLTCVKRLDCILKYLQLPASYNTCLRNRNRVVPSASLELQSEESILSDQEKEHWQNKSKSIFYLCI